MLHCFSLSIISLTSDLPFNFIFLHSFSSSSFFLFNSEPLKLHTFSLKYSSSHFFRSAFSSFIFVFSFLSLQYILTYFYLFSCFLYFFLHFLFSFLSPLYILTYSYLLSCCYIFLSLSFSAFLLINSES